MSCQQVTITGGSGFVGQLLQRGLREQGYRLQIFDTHRGALVNFLRRKYLASASNPKIIRSLGKRIGRTMARCERLCMKACLVRATGDDILAPRDALVQRFRGSDAVVHLAAIPHPYVPGMTDADFERINYQGSVNVLEAAREAGVKRFVFASSAQVYRINDPVRIDQFPILETNYCPTLEEGQTAYGHQKLRFEQYLAEACQRSPSLQAVALRLEYPGLLSNTAHNLYISTSIENMVAGFVAALEADIPTGFETFNLADATVAESIVDIQQYLREKWPDVPNFTTGNQCLLSTEKLQLLTGFRPVDGGTHLWPGTVWV